MANFKRKKKKQYWHVTCCRGEATRMGGNSRDRFPDKMYRQPQMYVYNERDPERYIHQKVKYE